MLRNVAVSHSKRCANYIFNREAVGSKGRDELIVVRQDPTNGHDLLKEQTRLNACNFSPGFDRCVRKIDRSLESLQTLLHYSKCCPAEVVPGLPCLNNGLLGIKQFEARESR